MRRRQVVTAAVGVLVAGAAAAALLGGLVGPGNGSGAPAYPRTLVFDDEFNGASGALPDPKVWKIAQNADATDAEKQCYTDSPDNVATDGEGHLAISALKQAGNCADGWYRFVTSGRIDTEGTRSFTYGRFEIRAQVPAGAGTWPAFWALGDVKDPWPTAGEIDVLEAAGRLPSTLIGTAHGPRHDDADQQYFLQATRQTAQPLSAGFHTYGVVWQPGKLTWTLDGQPYGSVTPATAQKYGGDWVWNHPYYLILNLAMGGVYGGEIPDSATYPQRLLVDWIRVYQ